MTIPEASQLVLQASVMGRGGEVFVLDMGDPVKIVDLARNLILLSGLRPDQDIRIEFTGTRPGEKLYEELSHLEEGTVPTQHDQLRVFAANAIRHPDMEACLSALREACAMRNTGGILSALTTAIPDYSPSEHLLARVDPPKPACQLDDRSGQEPSPAVRYNRVESSGWGNEYLYTVQAASSAGTWRTGLRGGGFLGSRVGPETPRISRIPVRTNLSWGTCAIRWLPRDWWRVLTKSINLPPIWAGPGYIFTGEHDAAVMHNSATINLNTLEYGHRAGGRKVFYSSSACIYPEYNQTDPDNPKCYEDSAYPAAPDSEYGWENSSASDSTCPTPRNYGFRCESHVFTIFSARRTWRAGGKRPRPRSAEKWPRRQTEEKSKSGAMGSNPILPLH